MLSEEEIIKECKRIIFEYGCIRKDTEGEKEDLQALEGLLDLYNKEKEKNEENIKSIEEWINGERISVKCISKDKIRELKELVHKTLDDNGITRAFQLVIDDYFDSVLEE